MAVVARSEKPGLRGGAFSRRCEAGGGGHVARGAEGAVPGPTRWRGWSSGPAGGPRCRNGVLRERRGWGDDRHSRRPRGGHHRSLAQVRCAGAGTAVVGGCLRAGKESRRLAGEGSVRLAMFEGRPEPGRGGVFPNFLRSQSRADGADAFGRSRPGSHRSRQWFRLRRSRFIRAWSPFRVRGLSNVTRGRTLADPGL